MAKKLKKAISFFLTIVIVLSMFNATVLAAESDRTPICGMEEHTHQTGCPEDCSITVHTHNYRCYPAITSDVVWNDGDVIDTTMISGGTASDPITITVNGTVTLIGSIVLDNTVSCHVVFNGNGTLVRGKDLNQAMIRACGTARNYQFLTVEGIVLDGGAVWSGETHTTLGRGIENTGVQTTAEESGILVMAYADVDLKQATLQNQASDNWVSAAAYVRYGTLTLIDSVVTNNYKGSNRGGAIHMRNGAALIANNTAFIGNHGVDGSVAGTSSSKAYGSVMEFTGCTFTNNYSNGTGALLTIQDNQFPAAGSTPPNYKYHGHVDIIGCTITGNSCASKENGLIYSHAYESPVYIEDSTITGNDCGLFGYTSNRNRNLYISNSVIEAAETYTDLLSEVPFKIAGPIGSMPLNETTIGSFMGTIHLANQPTYGYIASEAKGYTITDDDVKKMLGETASYIKADVDGDCNLDIVPVDGTAPSTVSVTMHDKFPGSDATETMDVFANLFPACPFTHEGYVFTGWVDANGEAVSKEAIVAGVNLYAQWKVDMAKSVVATSSAYTVTLGSEFTLSVSADLTPKCEYTYQWYLDGSQIAGANGTTLTTSSNEIGWHHYTCTVTAVQSDGFYSPVIDTAVSNTVRVYVGPIMIRFEIIDKDTSQNIDGATIVVTDSEGNVIPALADNPNLYLVESGETYTYEITAEGYVSHTEAIEISGSQTIHISMENVPAIVPDTPSTPNTPSSPSTNDTVENDTVEIEDEAVPLAGPDVFTTDHFAYIIGSDDGLVHPNANITRAEVATIFFRLLKDEVREQYITKENNFSDVKEGDWYNTAVSTMVNMGVINGYPDNTFRPQNNITRAEFAAIAARFAPGSESEAFFVDITGHWAEEEIAIAAFNGWVTGYEDNSFRPDNSITRAEAMTLVNRILLREPKSVDDLLPGMVEWADNMDTSAWYYLAVQEATNSHNYEYKDDGYESWTELLENRDWSELEK